MTYTILVDIPKPDKATDAVAYATWLECGRILRNEANQNKDLEILGENVLLITLQSNLRALHSVLGDIPLKYRYAILKEEIEWQEESEKV